MKSKVKYLIILILSCILLLMTMSISLADEGSGNWEFKNSKWYFRLTNGDLASNCWVFYNNDWYALDEEGKMIEGWCKIENSWYYFIPNHGAAAYPGWRLIDNGWFYFRSDNSMYTGWLEYKNCWYYFSPEDGHMVTESWIDNFWVDASGAWTKTLEANISNESVYVGSDFNIKEKIKSFKSIFPEGTYWNHMGYTERIDYSNYVTAVPCNHNENGMKYCNSYLQGSTRGFQCDGFARKMSDLVFGKEAPIVSYEFDFSTVKVGDYLRYSINEDNIISNGHSVFVTAKTGDAIYVVEANYGGSCMIHWGSRLTKDFLDQVYVECYTRY